MACQSNLAIFHLAKGQKSDFLKIGVCLAVICSTLPLHAQDKKPQSRHDTEKSEQAKPSKSIPTQGSLGHLTIVTPPFPGLFNENGKGYYDKLFQTIGKKTGYTVSVHILPSRRVIRQFNKDKSHCLFPSNLVPQSPKHIRSIPFNYAKSYLVGTKNTPPPLTTLMHNDDTYYKIAIRAGLDYGPLKKLKNVTFLEAETEAQNIRVLLAGRADYAAVYFPDIMLETPHSLPLLRYDKTTLLTVIPEEIICWQNSSSGQILPSINHYINEMKKKQTLKALLGAAYQTKD